MLRWLGKVTGEDQRSVAVPRHDPIITLPSHQAKRYFSRIEKSIAVLREEYDVRECVGEEYRQLESDLRRFSAHGNPKQLRLLNGYSLRSARANGYWFTFAYYEEGGGSRTSYAGDFIRQGAIVKTPFLAGDVFIRPEGFTDMVNEWFEGVEVDFPDYPRFCRKYYVLAADKEELRKHLPREVLESLSQTSGLFVRFLNDMALVASDRIIKPHDVVRTVEIAMAFHGSK